MISPEGIKQIMQIPGNVRGGIIQADIDVIRKKEGEKGLKAVEEKMLELGYPLGFENIKLGGWYPEALSVSIILIARDLFGWKESDIFDMGYFAPASSFISKIFMRYFLSLKRFLDEVPNYWRKHFDFGELEAYDFSEEKRYIILREKGYKFHPLMCVYHKGYYLRVAEFAIKSSDITIEETKCVFKGDSFHEYIIKW